MTLMACTTESPAPAPREAGYRYIGLIVPQNGPLAPLGESLKIGAEMAVAAANAPLDKHQRPFRLLVEDETATIPDASRLAADPRVLIMVGHTTERSLETMTRLYLKTGRPVLLPMIADDRAMELGEGLFYRVGPSYADQAQALARYALDRLAAKTAAVVRHDSRFSRLLSETFIQTWKSADRQEVREIVSPGTPSSGNPWWAPLVEYKPDVTFLALPTIPAVEVIQALNGAKVKTNFLGSLALAHADVVALMARQSSPAFLSLPLPLDETREDRAAFLKQFDSQHHHPPDWGTVLGYDTTRLALAALAQAGDNPEAVKPFLDQLSSPQQAYRGLVGDYWFRAKGQGQAPVNVVPVNSALMDRVPGF